MKTNRGAVQMRQLGLTQYEIAEKLGCPQGQVSHWMSGKRKPSAQWRIRIQKKLKIAFESWDIDCVEAAA